MKRRNFLKALGLGAVVAPVVLKAKEQTLPKDRLVPVDMDEEYPLGDSPHIFKSLYLPTGQIQVSGGLGVHGDLYVGQRKK